MVKFTQDFSSYPIKRNRNISSRSAFLSISFFFPTLNKQAAWCVPLRFDCLRKKKKKKRKKKKATKKEKKEKKRKENKLKNIQLTFVGFGRCLSNETFSETYCLYFLLFTLKKSHKRFLNKKMIFSW